MTRGDFSREISFKSSDSVFHWISFFRSRFFCLLYVECRCFSAVVPLRSCCVIVDRRWCIRRKKQPPLVLSGGVCLAAEAARLIILLLPSFRQHAWSSLIPAQRISALVQLVELTSLLLCGFPSHREAALAKVPYPS